ncbi:hypothetical protein KIN34_09815 [Cellulomonas sp. DKR-3]|uniref:Uncharacterized protein n=1 Tax=Cellulomonas fulva TaxID=2835530 RepID=A0ABS5TZK1_9CELL|nr:DUF6716 putative glycosyltransferase [Cellulomonas fulva]MBT0994582.1 hypothetical protein [Cellulomonas fulva]
MTAVRVLGVADSDSYLKWAGTTLERLAADPALSTEPALVVLRSPVEPTEGQVASALARTRWAHHPPARVNLGALGRTLRSVRPDVVLVATTGPAAEHVLRLLARLPYRPVVVTGLPGMSLPATPTALRYRSTADLFVVHSHHERTAFTNLADELGDGVQVRSRFVVCRLPFLAPGSPVPDTAPLHRVVFAPQAKFPVDEPDRVAILRALGELALARPDLDVVIKLRGLAGDAQTHRERWPFDELAREHAEVPGVPAVRVATGPLHDHLTPGTALVTVSSTAVLEALALGLRALVIGDFGIGDENLTGVYADSGLVGSLADVAAGRVATADPAWVRENYLQAEPDELGAALAAALAVPAPPLGTPAPVGALPSRLRRRARLVWPAGARRGRAVADVLLRRR